jgi:hypothetical protein
MGRERGRVRDLKKEREIGCERKDRHVVDDS